MTNEPRDPAEPGAGTPEPTPARVGCALPFVLGAAIVVGLVLLFLYLLIFW